jgi:hypothetical protein
LTHSAYANLCLNGVNNPEIYAQSAQQYRLENPDKQFDYVLMNPPFDSGVVTDLLTLAVGSLNDGGRAALLAPPGVVQRNDDRIRLLASGLQAVITLPPDVFRPYNGIRSHILLMHRTSSTDPIWLCDLHADGFGTGKARPLDQPAYPEASELPRTLTLIQRQQQGVWPFVQSLTDGIQLEVVSLPAADDPDKHPAGLALRLAGTEAQPIMWAAYHMGRSALIWWEQHEMRQNEQLLYASYVDDIYVLLTRTKTETIAWRDQLAAAAPSQQTRAEWEVAGTKISLLWETDTLILKHSGKGSFADFSMAVANSGDYAACLLNESGIPVSAWYRSTELPEQVEKAVTGRGQILYDAIGEVTGWLLPFSADEDSLTLLVVQQISIQLFVSDNQTSRLGLLWEAGNDEEPESGGVWYIANGSLITSSGPRLNSNLRTPDGKALGIAFGPQVADPNEAILFGVYVARATLEQQLLEPERYLPEGSQVGLRQRPSEILAKIRQQQRAMDAHIDTLLSIIGQKTTPFLDAMPLPMDQCPSLNDAQKTLWRRLTIHTETYLSLKQIEEMGCQGNLFTRVEVRQQLDLFMSLGLLLPVTVEKQSLFRCVRISDG